MFKQVLVASVLSLSNVASATNVSEVVSNCNAVKNMYITVVDVRDKGMSKGALKAYLANKAVQEDSAELLPSLFVIVDAAYDHPSANKSHANMLFNDCVKNRINK